MVPKTNPAAWTKGTADELAAVEGSLR